MKAANRLSRYGVLAASVIVMMILAEVVGNASVSITTANSAITSYTLAPGATSSAITPATSTGVLVEGTNLTTSNFSVATVNLVHIQGNQIRWVGLESAPSSTVVHGETTTPGTHIVYLDFQHKVDLEILSADEVVVHNRATTTQTGKVKLIW